MDTGKRDVMSKHHVQARPQRGPFTVIVSASDKMSGIPEEEISKATRRVVIIHALLCMVLLLAVIVIIIVFQNLYADI